jgi:hypothetical protein
MAASSAIQQSKKIKAGFLTLLSPDFFGTLVRWTRKK